MSTQIPSTETLRIGYPLRTKAVVGTAACLGWLLTYSILGGDASFLAGIPAAIAAISSYLFVVTFRSGFLVDDSKLVQTTWQGRKEYRRSEFLSAESVPERRGAAATLLRFESGVAVLSEARGCSNPEAIRTFIQGNWKVPAVSQVRPSVGPVDQTIELQYEPLHLALLAFATIAFATMSSFGPMLWVAAVLAFFCGRTLYFVSSSRHISAGPEGITITRPFQPKLTVAWDQITSVRYWHSLVHGGMILSDGQRTIRVYRWIQNYPRFNRLVQDLVSPSSLPAARSLPWKISLNRRRQSSLLVLFVTAGVSLWLVEQDAWPAASLFFGIPALTFLFTVLSSDRRLEITGEPIRLFEKKSFRQTTHDYNRAELEDMRLGRQLSAGGLWLNFGQERLEIANVDSECAPEEVLAVLRREWQAKSPATAPKEFRVA
ncbi:MAG: hypothetical protein ABIR70_09455 [Bryobacteraceae bacterium]